MSKPSPSKSTGDHIAKIELKNRELQAQVWVLENDLKGYSELARENRNLVNLCNAQKAEIARLTAPKPAHRPRKDATGTYEFYLFRTAAQLVAEARGRHEKLSEKDAALKADGLIREDAAKLQALGIPGAFAGLAADYPADPDSIGKAFRRGKRAAGMAQKVV